MAYVKENKNKLYFVKLMTHFTNDGKMSLQLYNKI